MEYYYFLKLEAGQQDNFKEAVGLVGRCGATIRIPVVLSRSAAAQTYAAVMTSFPRKPCIIIGAVDSSPVAMG